MLPSLLARDIQQGLQQFLITGFEPSDDFLHGLMQRFVEDKSGWLKGPYLQVGLPFTSGSAGRKFFKDFETEFPGFNHQEHAWQRLSSQHLADHTLVATGTGSGKTECFLYPVLDHCARARKAGEAGIKALVIYPMNALATDQARRFAQLIAATPAFAGLDHLRLVTQDEPGKDGGPRRHFVMLYDSVPGGTGYLHQLLAQDAGTLADVLRMALETINKCSCNEDPEKDGCYRCVYQYRLGRNMNLVSRDRGKEVLTELVTSLDQLEKVSTISDIFINPNFDSVLESRFIESLRRMGGTLGLPPVKLVQDIVNGKSGYVMEVAGQRYRIEPQCNIGPSEGVAVASKPDFVIWPWQVGSSRKPIAVFCDGWAYHQNSLREDAAKRSALVASGNFWVWSVTHEDVKMALSSAAGTDLDSPLVTFNRHDGSSAPPGLPRAAQGAFAYQAVFQLLSLLAVPPGPAGTPDVGVTQLQRNALWLGYLMVPSNATDLAEVKTDMATWMSKLPTWLQSPGAKHVPSLSRKDASPVAFAWWPMACADGKLENFTAPGALVLDDLVDQTEARPHLSWRSWLQLFNTLQTLPGMVMATVSGIQVGDLESLGAVKPLTVASVGTFDHVALSQEWTAALDMTLEVLRPRLRALAKLGAMPPVVGHELADERGMVVAEAEMAWLASHLVLLTFDQSDLEGIWKNAGWKTLVLAEDAAKVGGVSWNDAVCDALGIAISKKSNEGESA